MPSGARTAFEANRADIDRLWAIHGVVAGQGPGRKHEVEVLNRAAIVFITACWEAYVEDVATEAFDFMLAEAATADVLPVAVRMLAARELIEGGDKRKVWDLADGGWRTVLKNHRAAVIKKWVTSLNTPKANQVDKLFEDIIGLRQLTGKWSWQKCTPKRAAEKLDWYITARGQIAHRVKHDDAVYKSWGTDYLHHVEKLVEKTDLAVADHIEVLSKKATVVGGEGQTVTQLDPRLIEIEILSEADRAFVRGDASYQYTKANPSGPKDRQRDEALLGLISEGAVVAAGGLRASKNYVHIPDINGPDPRFPLDDAAARAIAKFISPDQILDLKITQAGRLRLFRLRDEILQRDRIRDALAGLWAKQHFLPDLTVKLRIRDVEKPISLIVIDVDHLRDINSELGHHGADQVLTGILETLRDVVQPHDAYRIGGDEAGAILPGVSLHMAEKLAEEIRASIAGRAWPDLSIKTKPTISVGVGTYSGTKQIEAEALYAAVDALAIQAKESGKNKVFSANVPVPGA